MRRPLRPALLVAAALLAGRAAAAGPGRPLTERERAGKRIFLHGESPSGGGISARIGGDAVLPATALPCASCHGSDGLGRPEGGADPGRLLWSHLVRASGHVHEDGRRHGAFDARSLARAVRDGTDPAGNALAPAMPRFSMSSEDLASLVSYLKVLERDFDPGVSDKVVRIGTVLPTRGRLASLGEAVRGVLAGSLGALDAEGGLHGRRVVLEVAAYDPDRESGLAAAERLLARGDVFALVSGFTPAAEEEIAALAEREKVPLVGPLTSFTRAADPANTQVFYVGAGLAEQARALARWAASERRVEPGHAAIVHAADAPLAQAAAAGKAELEKRGAGQTAVFARPAGSLDPGLVPSLRAAGATTVLFLGPDEDVAAFGRAAAEAGYAPELLLSGTLSARAAVALPAAFAGKVHLAYGALPSDETPAGSRLLADARARGKGKAGESYRTAQLSALAAAEVLAEALRRTGRHLTREKLTESLEALYRFETGVVPPLTFGPGRRVGALGAYVVAVDLEKHGFLPVSGWIALE